ncbi:MAG: hypothetical protein KDD04_00860 [Sinomicrobium sp.]|nr:hypothetical protein [Sinomicrobium sp.]
MRTVLALAVGFWIARQIYVNFDKQQARIKEAKVKKRLRAFLEENGLSPDEADMQSKRILKV